MNLPGGYSAVGYPTYNQSGYGCLGYHTSAFPPSTSAASTAAAAAAAAYGQDSLCSYGLSLATSDSLGLKVSESR